MKMEEWKEYSIHDITRRVKVGFVGSCENDYCSINDKDAIPMIRTTDLTNYIIHFDNQKFVTKEFHEKNIKSQLHKHDLLIARHGDNGKTCIYESDEPANCLNVIIIEPDNNKCDYKFLKYMFDSSSVKNILSGTLVGSVQPVLNTKTVENLIIKIPPLPIQKKIAAILSSLDDKIELNNKINTNLEQQAQALFKNWFVDFEPFGGKMPAEWKVGKLSDIAEITMGQSPDGKSYNEDGIGTVFYQGRAEFGTRFPTRRLFTTEPKRIAHKFDTLMSVRAPVGDLNIANEECCIGRGLAAMHSKDDHQSFVHYTVQALRPQLDVFNGEGTVFGCINKDALNNMDIVIPTKEELERFEKIVATLDADIYNRSKENDRLKNIRDTLLQKLMNGEIEV